jgi:hypothetical protein
MGHILRVAHFDMGGRVSGDSSHVSQGTVCSSYNANVHVKMVHTKSDPLSIGSLAQ